MKVCKVSDLAQEVNIEDFLIIMSYFQPMDTRVGEEQAQVNTHTHTKKNSKISFHVYDSGNNTGRLSKCEEELSRNHHTEKYSIHSNAEEAMMDQPESADEQNLHVADQSLIRCWRGSQLTTPWSFLAGGRL